MHMFQTRECVCACTVSNTSHAQVIANARLHARTPSPHTDRRGPPLEHHAHQPHPLGLSGLDPSKSATHTCLSGRPLTLSRGLQRRDRQADSSEHYSPVDPKPRVTAPARPLGARACERGAVAADVPRGLWRVGVCGLGGVLHARGQQARGPRRLDAAGGAGERAPRCGGGRGVGGGRQQCGASDGRARASCACLQRRRGTRACRLVPESSARLGCLPPGLAALEPLSASLSWPVSARLSAHTGTWQAAETSERINVLSSLVLGLLAAGTALVASKLLALQKLACT